MENWNKLFITIALVVSIGFAGRVFAKEEGAEDEVEEVEIMETDLSKLPEIILTAAQGAMENFVITGFSEENEGDQLITEVKGLVGETCYEIEISEKGQILETEKCD